MVDQLLGALLMLLGVGKGSVRGDSTVSAQILSTAAVPPPSAPFIAAFDLEVEKSTASRSGRQASISASLSKINNAGKRAIIEKIQLKLTELNTLQTQKMMAKLNQWYRGMELLESASLTYEKETSGSAQSAVAKAVSAKLAISDAAGAVTIQAGKLYEIPIATESGAKASIQKQRVLLADDLKKLREAIKTARTKVVDAVKAFRKDTGITGPIPVPNP